MPRYFFNVRYRSGPDGVARDDEGDDLADLATVRAHALHVARDLILRTRFDMIRNLFDCAFEITDEHGEPVLIVPFADAVFDQEV